MPLCHLKKIDLQVEMSCAWLAPERRYTPVLQHWITAKDLSSEKGFRSFNRYHRMWYNCLLKCSSRTLSWEEKTRKLNLGVAAHYSALGGALTTNDTLEFTESALSVCHHPDKLVHSEFRPVTAILPVQSYRLKTWWLRIWTHCFLTVHEEDSLLHRTKKYQCMSFVLFVVVFFNLLVFSSESQIYLCIQCSHMPRKCCWNCLISKRPRPQFRLFGNRVLRHRDRLQHCADVFAETSEDKHGRDACRDTPTNWWSQ